MESTAGRHRLERIAGPEFSGRELRESAARLNSHADLQRPLLRRRANAVCAAQLLAVDRDLEWQMLAGQESIFVREFFRYTERNAHRVLGFVLDAFDGQRMKFFHVRCT